MTSNLWDGLSKEWQTCVRLAWEAYCAGSLPIAALITDESDAIVATGRNRIGDAEQAYPRISNHPLAHAEMNALLTLDTRRVNPHTCTLYTTTEPCPLCMGAIRMTGLRRFHYACREPWAGSSLMAELVPCIKRKNVTATPPQSSALENVLTALLVDYYVRYYARQADAPNVPFLPVYADLIPAGTRAGVMLGETGELFALAQRGAAVGEMLGLVEGIIKRYDEAPA